MSETEPSPLSARHAYGKWAPNDAHYTLNLVPFSEVIDSLDLTGKTVIEIGTGSGLITQLLLNRAAGKGGPAKVVSYEIDPKATPTYHDPRLEVRIEDFTKKDLKEFANRDDVVLVSNPPYSLFPQIKNMIAQCGIRHVAMMASAEDALEHFKGYDVYAAHTGEDFLPIAEGDHYIIGTGLHELEYRSPEIPPANIVPAHSRVEGSSMPAAISKMRG